jgi:hypothetical protein
MIFNGPVTKFGGFVAGNGTLNPGGGVGWSGDSTLLEVHIPEKTWLIGTYAFRDCTALETVVIPKTITKIEEGAFESAYNLSSIKVDLENSVYDSRENCNAIIETATNTLIAGCKNTVIVNGIKRIGEYAFSRSKNLSIVLPDSVRCIAYGAFI